MDLNLLVVDAKKYFIDILKGVSDPEQKEKSLAELLLIFSIMSLQN